MGFLDQGLSRLVPRTGDRLGDFEIIRRIGTGGMGVVYLARQVSVDRLVALKILSPLVTRDKTRRRFLREAQTVASLSHPNIVSVHAIHEDADLCYYAMEFVEGWPLSRVITRLAGAAPPYPGVTAIMKAATPDDDEDEEGEQATTVPVGAPASTLEMEADALRQKSDRRTTGSKAHRREGTPAGARRIVADVWYIRQVAVMMRDVANALAYAHTHGIIHRDVKPDNLLMDVTGVLHLVDFGLARILEQQSITLSGELMGTPLYMSPEQVSAGRIGMDHRTDLYSLGVVMYHLLTLTPPFEAETREGLLRAIAITPPPPLTGRNPAVPRPLETIVHKAMEKNPERRYASGTELADDLDRWLAGSPILAKRRTRMRRWWNAQPQPVRLGIVASGGVALCWLVMVVSSLAMLFDSKPAAEAKLPDPPDPSTAIARAYERATDCDYAGSALWHAKALEQGVSLVGPAALPRAIAINQIPPLHYRFPLLGPGPRYEFHPGGNTLVTCPTPNQMRLWNLATRDPAGAPVDLGLFIDYVSFAPDGSNLLAISTESTKDTARWYDISGKAAPVPPIPDLPSVRYVRRSKDGLTVALISAPDELSTGPREADGTWNVSVYRFNDGQRVERITTLKAMLPVELNPKGQVLAAGKPGGLLEIVDLNTKRPIRHAWKGWPEALAFAPNSPTLVVADRQGGLTLLDSGSGRPAPVQPVLPAEQSAAYGNATRLTFSHNGDRLAVIGSPIGGDPTARRMIGLWDVGSGKQIFVTTACDARLTESGNRLIFWDHRSVTLIDAGSGAFVNRLSPAVRFNSPASMSAMPPVTGGSTSGAGLKVSADQTGHRLLVIDSNPDLLQPALAPRACIWDADLGERICCLLTPLPSLLDAGILPSGRFAYAVAESATTRSELYTWDLREQYSFPRIMRLPATPISSSQLILGRRPFVAMLSMTDGRYVRHMLDGQSLQPLHEPVVMPHPPSHWTINASGTVRLEIIDRRRVQLVDVERGVNVDTWTVDSPALAIALSAPGNVAAIAQENGEITLRRALSDRTSRETGRIGPLAWQPLRMRLSPNGQMLAVAGPDGLIQLYDLKATPKLARQFATRRPVHEMAFCFGDALLVAAHTGGSASLWSTSEGQQPMMLAPRPTTTQPAVAAQPLPGGPDEHEHAEDMPTIIAVRDSAPQPPLLATACGNCITLWPLTNPRPGEALEPPQSIGMSLGTTHPIMAMAFTSTAARAARHQTSAPSGGEAADWLMTVTTENAMRWFNVSSPYRTSEEWQRLVADRTGMRITDRGDAAFVPLEEWLANRQALERRGVMEPELP